MGKIIEKTEGILSNPKRAIAFGIIVLIVVILFFVFKNQITNLIQKIKTKQAENQELNEEISSGGKLTFTENQYILFANKLYDAMKGFGTNFDNVYYVFQQMKTKADVLKLNMVFGVRDGETLSQWLHGEWSIGFVGYVNGILSKKGIDYQF